jgi:hypothetical protein
MISFRKFVLVGAMLAAFAGLAAAQPAVTTLNIVPGSNPATPMFPSPTLRAEGITEALPYLTVTITANGVPELGVKATYDLTLLSTSGAPITSPTAQILVAPVGGVGVAMPGTAVYGGVVRIPGVVFTFDGIDATASIVIEGLRIDANAIGPNAFVTLQATAFPSNGVIPVGVTANPVTATNATVATILTSLKTTVTPTSDNATKGSTTSGPWTSTMADGSAFDPTATDPATLNPAGALFTAKFMALYAGAFLVNAPENDLRFTFTITNIPSGLTLYVPQTAGPLTLILGTDANGFGGYPAPATVASYAVPANGMVTYQLDPAAINVGNTPAYSVPVYSVGTTPLAVTSAAAPFTFTGGYAPLSTDVSNSASKPILRFATTSVTEYDSFIVVNLPSSHFAFPYVVTGNGWVTGIAIINGGAGFGSAADPTKGNAGTCKLTFYSADGTVVAPTAVTVPLTGAAETAIVPGGNYGFTLDQAIGTGSYAGIVFGACTFDNAKAFGYLNGDGTTAAYLAQ